MNAGILTTVLTLDTSASRLAPAEGKIILKIIKNRKVRNPFIFAMKN